MVDAFAHLYRELLAGGGQGRMSPAATTSTAD
jgi:hypothetical protein